MQSGEIIDKLREYNKSLSKLKLTQSGHLWMKWRR